eukprot:TRINITY_DN20975_c0_g1_i1.p1 TRINITY_DN20975_c0_g1~~TRINITY_DN20975_c0_g1_i1.p1  ORF type:complete len:102 (+),score=2.52 TRINITY_DN20975_c0_g1_i1:64-369(+)
MCIRDSFEALVLSAGFESVRRSVFAGVAGLLVDLVDNKGQVEVACCLKTKLLCTIFMGFHNFQDAMQIVALFLFILRQLYLAEANESFNKHSSQCLYSFIS